MGGMKLAAAMGVLVGAGFLTGCCLFSGTPTVTIVGPTTATVGTPITFTATVQGGTGPYTYMWSIGGSGPSVMYTFQASGPQTVTVTVFDSCGKQAQASHPITITGDQSGGDNLTGMWSGTLYEQGIPNAFQLQLTHVGTSVTGMAFIVGASSPGSGSYAAGRFTFQFQIPGRTTFVVLVGSYNPYARELSGTWTIGGIEFGTWRVMRN